MIHRHPAEPCVFVVFGGTGDLARRKILPALFKLYQDKDAPDCVVVGVTRSAEIDDAHFRSTAVDAVTDAGLPADAARSWADKTIYYQPINSGTPQDFKALAARIAEVEEQHGIAGNRVFYIALPPQAFADTIAGLAAAGLSSSRGWTRLVVEKPFGR